MSKHARQQQILQVVETTQELRLRELRKRIEASDATIRRDLRELSAKGQLGYSHGLIRRRSHYSLEKSFHEKSEVATAEKMAIAQAAGELIEDGDVVIIGAGTTAAYLARQLSQKHIEVWTNSLLVAEELADAPSVKVHLSGGDVRGAIRALVGSRAERFFAGLRAPYAFLSANGFTAARGLSTPNHAVAEVDRALSRAAVEIVALLDHTKIGEESLIATVPTSRISQLITDGQAAESVLNEARHMGVSVHVIETAN